MQDEAQLRSQLSLILLFLNCCRLGKGCAKIRIFPLDCGALGGCRDGAGAAVLPAAIPDWSQSPTGRCAAGL